MLIHVSLLLGAWCARGTVIAIPRQPIIALREDLNEYLTRGTNRAALLNSDWSMGMGHVRAALIALEEVSRHLQARPGKIVQRVNKILDRVPDLVIGLDLNDEDRGTLRGYLQRVLRTFARRPGRLDSVLLVYSHFGFWGPDDLWFAVQELETTHYIVDAYDRLLQLGRALGPEDLVVLRDALLANRSNPSIRFALLEELNALPNELHKSLLAQVRATFVPDSIGRIKASVKDNDRRLMMRALGRLQDRFHRGDAVVEKAFGEVRATTRGEFETVFNQRFSLGQLPIDVSIPTLRASDPLKLTLPKNIPSNVVSFCDRALRR